MASPSDATPSNGNTPEQPESGSAPETAEGPERRGQVRLRRAAIMAVLSHTGRRDPRGAHRPGRPGVQFSISGMPFTVTAKSMDGTGFEQFGDLDNMIPDSPNAGDTGGQELIITSAIKNATLDSLCQSVDLGGVNLLIKAGSGATKVTATDLTTDSTEMSGNASFNNIEIGNDASTLNKAGVQGKKGVFSQQADTVHIDNLRQTNYATTAGVFKLPGLKLSFSDSGC